LKAERGQLGVKKWGMENEKRYEEPNVLFHDGTFSSKYAEQVMLRAI
jgi:hypothetical protein